PPAASCSLVSPHRERTKPSPSLTLLADRHRRRLPHSFPRSPVGMPSATLRVGPPRSDPRRTQSVPDGIPTRSMGTRLSPRLSSGYHENPVVIGEESPFLCFVSPRSDASRNLVPRLDRANERTPDLPLSYLALARERR